MHILIVHDGSARADAAAMFVLQFAPHVATRLTLVDASGASRSGPGVHRSIADIGATAERHGLTVDVVSIGRTSGTSIVATIVGRVSSSDTDLIALSTGPRRGLSRFTEPLAETLLRRAPVPVMIIGDTPRALDAMLVCTSLQLPHGSTAIDPAISIARATGASVDVLHVMSQLPRDGGRTDVAGKGHDVAWHRQHRTAEGRHLDEMRAVFADRGIDVHARIRHGLVVDEIVAHARQQPADLVVLGAHGDGHPSWLLENITERVVRELSRPVLVLRQPPALVG